MVRPDDERPGSGSHWVKSSLSFSNGNCVEVANLSEGGVAVRNSRDPEGPVLRFTPDEWHAFLGGAQLGEFDSFGRLRVKSREQRRVLPDGPGGTLRCRVAADCLVGRTVRGLAEKPCVQCRLAASPRPPRRGLRGRVP